MGATRADSWIPFGVGVLLWLAARLAAPPQAATFFDEVGYVGQARLFASGAIAADSEAPGVWFDVDGSLLPLYPPGWAAVLTPFVVAAPELASLASALAAVGASFAFALLLCRFGAAPVWGLLLLAHPTVGLFSRVAMPDVAATGALLAFWLALEADRPWRAGTAGAAAVLLKPTALVVVGAWLLVEGAARTRTRRSVLVPGSLAAGAAIIASQLPNGYALSLAGHVPFSLAHLGTSGLTLAALVLAAPPLLVLGAVPLTRARAFGALAGAAALLGILGCYYFVDRGRSWTETLVVGPRLALPAFAILLVGWTAALSRGAKHLPPALVAAACVGSPCVVQIVLGARHGVVLEELVRVRERAEILAQSAGSRSIDVTPAAQKALILTPFELRSVAAPGRADVFVCATRGSSWREEGPAGRCDPAPGFRTAERIGPFVIQVRSASEPQSAVPGSSGEKDSRRDSTAPASSENRSP